MGFGKGNQGIIVRERASQALGTLADGVVILLGGLTPTEDFRMLKSEVIAYIIGLTAGDDMNGLLFGIANGELSVAEIKECLEIAGPLDRNDRDGHEKALRNVKILGAIGQIGETDTVAQFKNENGGPTLINKHRWTYNNPEGWSYFLYNNTGSAMITGSTCKLYATNYGVWVT